MRRRRCVLWCYTEYMYHPLDITFLNRSIRGPKGLTCRNTGKDYNYTLDVYPFDAAIQEYTACNKWLPTSCYQSFAFIINPCLCFMTGCADFNMSCDGLPHRIGLIDFKARYTDMAIRPTRFVGL